MSDYKLYTVERDGKTLKLKSSQLTVQILSKIFGLFPESILLLSNDGYVETADPDGRFHDVDDLSHWTVSGDSLKPPAGGASVDSQGPSGLNPFSYPVKPPIAAKRGRGKARWTPQFTTTLLGQRRKPPGVRTQEGESESEYGVPAPPQEWRKYVEVCKWSEQEKSWKKVSNLPVVVSEASANVKRVAEIVGEDVFNGDETVLLDIDYLKIPDTPSTRGNHHKCSYTDVGFRVQYTLPCTYIQSAAVCACPKYFADVTK